MAASKFHFYICMCVVCSETHCCHTRKKKSQSCVISWWFHANLWKFLTYLHDEFFLSHCNVKLCGIVVIFYIASLRNNICDILWNFVKMKRFFFFWQLPLHISRRVKEWDQGPGWSRKNMKNYHGISGKVSSFNPKVSRKLNEDFTLQHEKYCVKTWKMSQYFLNSIA